MKKIKFKPLIVLIVIINIAAPTFAQNYKIGIKLAPIYSQIYIHDETAIASDFIGTFNEKYQNDSLFLQIQAERASSTSSIIYRAAFCFGQFRSIGNYDEIQTNGTSQTIYSDNQTYTQNYWGLTLGIGNKYELKPFTFQLGVEIPFYLLPKGIMNREQKIEYSVTNWQHSVGVATFSNSFILGLGGFANISTTFFKKISVGFDISYRIQYFNQFINWDATTIMYNENNTPNTSTNTINEKIRNKQISITRIFPAIIISYCF